MFFIFNCGLLLFPNRYNTQLDKTLDLLWNIFHRKCLIIFQHLKCWFLTLDISASLCKILFLRHKMIFHFWQKWNPRISVCWFCFKKGMSGWNHPNFEQSSETLNETYVIYLQNGQVFPFSILHLTIVFKMRIPEFLRISQNFSKPIFLSIYNS